MKFLWWMLLAALPVQGAIIDASSSSTVRRPAALHAGVLVQLAIPRRSFALQGYLQLSATLSAEIFGSGAAQLVLQNDGDDLVLGLPPTILRQDLSVSLIGGSFRVGALAGGVSLQTSLPSPL